MAPLNSVIAIRRTAHIIRLPLPSLRIATTASAILSARCTLHGRDGTYGFSSYSRRHLSSYSSRLRAYTSSDGLSPVAGTHVRKFTRQIATSASASATETSHVALPNHRLLARAFHRRSTNAAHHPKRNLSVSAPQRQWQGRQAEENTSAETSATDTGSHNVQQEASMKGKAERQRSLEGESGASNSSATSERAAPKKGEGEVDGNQKAERESPRAPKPVIGMNDERGGKGR